jgi:hypothetical protein
MKQIVEHKGSQTSIPTIDLRSSPNRFSKVLSPDKWYLRGIAGALDRVQNRFMQERIYSKLMAEAECVLRSILAEADDAFRAELEFRRKATRIAGAVRS